MQHVHYAQLQYMERMNKILNYFLRSLDQGECMYVRNPNIFFVKL